MKRFRFSRRLDERGVALPLALFGVVIVSIAVAGMITMGGAEVANADAHRSGSASLYAAQSAVDDFVARRIATNGSNPFPDTLVADWAGHRLRVRPLALQTFNPGAGPWPTPASEPVGRSDVHTFSVTAESLTGRGRVMSALITMYRRRMPLKTNINSGAVFTNAFDIQGSSIVSGQQDTTLCKTGANGDAVQYSTGISGNQANCGSTNCIGAVRRMNGVNADSMRSLVLGGMSVKELMDNASIKFGFDGHPDFDRNADPSVNQTDPRYNWGCPKGLVAACASHPDTARYEVIAIKVPKTAGSKVTLNGGYGQGILVIEGDVDITGRFLFNGIVVVTGDTRITGTGMDGTQIQGAFLGLGNVQTGKRDSDETHIAGNAMIQFNRCAIAAAAAAASNNTSNARFTPASPTYGWFEVVR